MNTSLIEQASIIKGDYKNHKMDSKRDPPFCIYWILQYDENTHRAAESACTKVDVHLGKL